MDHILRYQDRYGENISFHHLWRLFSLHGQTYNRGTYALLGGNPSFLDNIKHSPPSVALCEFKIE